MSDLAGTLDGSSGEWDEGGFHLALTTDDGDTVRLRVPMEEGRWLLATLDPMKDWVAEHDRELAAYRRSSPAERDAVLGRESDDDSGYDATDPKSPGYVERMTP